jgi:hypothetical protein
VVNISEVPDIEAEEGNQIVFQINCISRAPTSDGADGHIVVDILNFFDKKELRNSKIAYGRECKAKFTSRNESLPFSQNVKFTLYDTVFSLV